MRAIDRVMRAGHRVGIGRRGTALLETKGRRTGQPRVTPVTNGLDDDRFWIVTEHGLRANYVRNLLADPHVRVNADGRWRTTREPASRRSRRSTRALGRTRGSSPSRPPTCASSGSTWTTEPP